MSSFALLTEYKQNVNKIMAYNLFHGNGLYGKVLNNKAAIKTLGFTTRP